MSLSKIYKKLLDKYIIEYDNICINEGYYKESDSNDVKDKAVKEAIREDLIDKKFTKGEVQEILEENATVETMYKFIAYACLVYDYNCGDSTDSLKEVIQERTSEVIDDIAVLQKIYLCIDQIDF